MNDLISRQAAITIPIKPKEHREYQTNNLDDAYEQGWEDLQALVAKLPSIDAVQVVWCEDCIHCDTDYTENGQYYCYWHEEYMRYCDKGEKRCSIEAKGEIDERSYQQTSGD